MASSLLYYNRKLYFFDRFGLSLLMNLAVGIVSAGMVVMGFMTAMPPVPLLVFTMLCIGYGNALSPGTLSHMINSVFARERKDFSSLFGFLFSVQNIGVMNWLARSGRVPRPHTQLSVRLLAVCRIADPVVGAAAGYAAAGGQETRAGGFLSRKTDGIAQAHSV